jgi:hypothetical protein
VEGMPATSIQYPQPIPSIASILALVSRPPCAENPPDFPPAASTR